MLQYKKYYLPIVAYGTSPNKISDGEEHSNFIPCSDNTLKNSTRVVEAGYYRSCWEYVRDDGTCESSRKLCLLLGKHGIAMNSKHSFLMFPYTQYINASNV